MDRALSEYVEHAGDGARQEVPSAEPLGAGAGAPESGAGSFLPPDEASGGETQEAGMEYADAGAQLPGGDMDVGITTNGQQRNFSKKRYPNAKLRHNRGQNQSTPDITIDDEIVMLVGALGGDSNKYKREYRNAANRMIAEI